MLPDFARRPPWHATAACVGQVDLMFDLMRKREAKVVCRRCLHRAECLAGALTRHEPAGVWGGFDTDERAALMREQRRTTANSESSSRR